MTTISPKFMDVSKTTNSKKKKNYNFINFEIELNEDYTIEHLKLIVIYSGNKKKSIKY